MSGPSPIYETPRRMLGVRLHPVVIDGLKEIAYRRRSTMTELLEDLSATALAEAGLPAPNPRRAA